MTLSVARIYRYPVKGLSPEALDSVALTPGRGLPGDRRFAIAHGTTRFDPAAPEWLPKISFLMLMRNERLARLETRFDAESGILTIARDAKPVSRANIQSESGRMVIEQFFATYMQGECRGAPRLVESPGHMFSDTERKVVSIIGLASIRDLERITREPVDPRRFRANVYFEGGRPWQEFQWLNRDLRLGPCRLRVVDRIDRCAATNVNPDTGQRDMNIPRAIEDGFRHHDMGVFAEVIEGGTIAPGMPLNPPT